ncbi:MAG TPA: DUF2188 domain-containing protein [Allosphingosinicella sp.]
MATPAPLPRFTLSFDRDLKNWKLVSDLFGRVVTRFATKEDATRGGTLEGALPNGVGTVRIHSLDGRFEEERTFPRSRDPERSPG